MKNLTIKAWRQSEFSDWKAQARRGVRGRVVKFKSYEVLDRRAFQVWGRRVWQVQIRCGRGQARWYSERFFSIYSPTDMRIAAEQLKRTLEVGSYNVAVGQFGKGQAFVVEDLEAVLRHVMFDNRQLEKL